MAWSHFFSCSTAVPILCVLACSPLEPGEEPRPLAIPRVEPANLPDPLETKVNAAVLLQSLPHSGSPFWVSRNPDGTLRAATGLNLPIAPTPSSSIGDQVRYALGAFLSMDPESTLELVSEAVDGAGFHHLSWKQSYQGIPVYQARLQVHTDGHQVTSFASSLVRLERVESTDNVGAEGAAAILQRDYGIVADPESAEQVIYPLGGNVGELAWKFSGFSLGRVQPEGPVRVMIGGVRGELLHWSSLAHDVADTPACVAPSQHDCVVYTKGMGDDGQSHELALYRGMGFPLPLLVDGYLHPYTEESYPDLFDSSDDQDIFFVDLTRSSETGSIYVIESDGWVFNAYDRQFFDSDDHFMFGPGPSFDSQEVFGAPVSAMAAVRETLDYYWAEHGRRGLDDDPDQPLDVVTRVGFKGFNATWVSDYHYICIGTYRETSVAVALDIVAHELTHAIVEFSSGLGEADQSGALDEALADIFGTLVQAEERGNVDWWIGEDIPQRAPLRNLAHPEIFDMPGHMDEYYQGSGGSSASHYNSGIVSKAFYLAAAGTRNGELYHGYSVHPADPDLMTSVRLLGQIAYNVIEYRLTPASGFTDWAVSMLAAVQEFSLPEAQADQVFESLRDAFLATGILTQEDGTPRSIVAGRVTSTNEGVAEPLACVLVQLDLGDEVLETSTNALGEYLLEPENGMGAAATVRAQKSGYYDVTSTVGAFSNDDAGQGTVIVDLSLEKRPPAQFSYSLQDDDSIQIPIGLTESVFLNLTNTGTRESQLTYLLRPTLDYTWTEIPFDWEDISTRVQPIRVTGDQGHSSAIRLQSPFPFYLGSYSELYVSTDGYITLTEDTTQFYREVPLPSADAPENLIAPFWADLDFGSSERAYFYNDTSRGIAYVQFEDVPDFVGEYTYTFQVMLLSDGRIRFYYRNIPGTPESWARVGIQDARGEEGVEVAVNTPGDGSEVPRSQSGLELTPSAPFGEGSVVIVGFDTNQVNGVVDGGETASLEFRLSAEGLDRGSYSIRLYVQTNDSEKPVQQILVPFEVY